MVWSVLAGMAMTVGNVAQEVGSPNNGAKSLVLIIDDPDAPDPRALKMVWVHWVVYNLPPDTKSSPENTGKTGLPQGADRVRQARNENERWRIELCRACDVQEISPAWGRNEFARKEKSVPIFVFLSLWHWSALDRSVYARPRLFQAVDITVGISNSPAMALHLLSRVWHSP
jgi:hypothetical protein